MAIDWAALDALRQTYQNRAEDVGQGDIEGWDPPYMAEAEAAALAAADEWLHAIHQAWPEIYSERRKETA